MPAPFNNNETGFTPTAGVLQTVPEQGLAFQIWGGPEREKINHILSMANQFLLHGGF